MWLNKHIKLQGLFVKNAKMKTQITIFALDSQSVRIYDYYYDLEAPWDFELSFQLSKGYLIMLDIFDCHMA